MKNLTFDQGIRLCTLETPYIGIKNILQYSLTEILGLPMWGIIRISFPPVISQLLSVVAPPLWSENFQIFCTNITVEKLVIFPHVILKLIERLIRPFITYLTTMFQQSFVCFSYVGSAENETESPILQIRFFEFRE